MESTPPPKREPASEPELDALVASMSGAAAPPKRASAESEPELVTLTLTLTLIDP